jgi:acyl transferase domain-containing protein
MVFNDSAHAAAPWMEAHSKSEATSKPSSTQDAIAVVGIACRLPGNSNTPDALWDFIERGSVAHNEPPKTRFNLKAHFDKSRKPHTMRSPGGMFLENIDPKDFDAGFFNTSRVDAIAMDPQQRQLLEVVYECLENAGISLEKLDGAAVGCFVGSYSVGMFTKSVLLVPNYGGNNRLRRHASS